MIRSVVVVDDHGIIAHLIGDSLRRIGYTVEVLDPAVLDDAGVIEAVQRHRNAIVLLDLHLGDRSSVELISPLTAHGAAVVLLTASEDETVIGTALEKGAIGVIHKSDPFDELLEAIAAVAEGRTLLSRARRDVLVAAARRSRDERARDRRVLADLTDAERAVLARLMNGQAVRDIASERVVSVETVRSQVKSILRKLGARNQVQALAIARDAGFDSTMPPSRD